MHDGTGNDLAKRSANADRGANGPEGEIEAARAPREGGDHQHRNNAEYSRPHTIQNLDRDQYARVGGEGISCDPKSPEYRHFGRVHDECEDHRRGKRAGHDKNRQRRHEDSADGQRRSDQDIGDR